MTNGKLLQWPCDRLLETYPYVQDFFTACGLSPATPHQTVGELLSSPDSQKIESLDFDQAQLIQRFLSFVDQMDQLRRSRSTCLRSITIIGGRDKNGRSEEIEIELHAGEVICLVGPTGAGKSMLLADIECMAQGDTPSGRRILVDHRSPDDTLRFTGEQRLVAQLSQNMNFIMDLSVEEFLMLHAESRLIENVDEVVARVFDTAVRLAGEPFDLATPVTALSGGQSRALMIADVACLSVSPIVLIDEIENAGVDRRQALDLLMQEEKIVIMATHDPLLALSGNRRVVIQNGGIVAVLMTSAEEKTILGQLDAIDSRITALRHRIRQGGRLVDDI